MHATSSRGRPAGALLLLLTLVTAAVASPPAMATTPGPGSAEPSPTALGGPLRLYTSVTQDTVDAVLAGFASRHPDVAVEVFRAPTGELGARIEAERREGRIRADVLWATDPLSMYQYDAQGLLVAWEPAGVEAVPEAFRTGTFFGTRQLTMVIVAGADVTPQPRSWDDLTEEAFRDGVAIPDPGFAGSAFAALAYFALTPAFGLEYYERLRANGAVQLSAIGDVITAVAEGRVKAGMALDKTVRDAVAQGSPITLVWPEPGGITMYSPIAILRDSEQQLAARALIEHVLSEEGQAAIASTGWRPIRGDVPGPPSEGPDITIDWATAFGRQMELLDAYRRVFEG